MKNEDDLISPEEAEMLVAGYKEELRQMFRSYRQFVGDNARVLWESQIWEAAIMTASPFSPDELRKVWEDIGENVREVAWGVFTEKCLVAGYDLDKKPEPQPEEPTHG